MTTYIHCPKCGQADQQYGTDCENCGQFIPLLANTQPLRPAPVYQNIQEEDNRTWLQKYWWTFIPLFFVCCLLAALMMTGLNWLRSAPRDFPPVVAPTAITESFPQSTAQPAQSGFVSLNYDETNSDSNIAGQTQLIALYLRFADPVTNKPVTITQKMLEDAIIAIQQEAAASNATTFQGTSLTLNQNQAWLVWCSDATQVDPPADVSLIHEVTLLAQNTLGRVWIQVPFALGVPLRTDDTWSGCNSPSGFWASAVK